MTNLYIGTSGFNYEHWSSGVFYPKGLPQSKWLEYYAKYFDTVELNVTFYRLPTEKTFESWYKKTPKNFHFAIKGSRFITHVKKLKDVKDSIRYQTENSAPLKEKLSVILWQLAPNFKTNPKRLEDFIQLLPKGRHAFEFRHESWFCPEIYDILKENKAALVLADSPSWPYHEEITADFIYLRLHGGQSLYSSNYSDKELKAWADKIKKWLKKNDIYIYFNNDARGFAIDNAKKLKDLCR
jgi:uncharacterized protein YecE (DUF72 family)